MARVCVIGAGAGGIAAAARLAKLGHQVTVFEREAEIGGSLRPVRADGFCWHRTTGEHAIPAVWRDLFRKSGRPIERYVDLELAPATRHVWPDGTTLDLPSTSRADQLRAIDSALGAGRGEAWSTLIDAGRDEWDLLRTGFLDLVGLTPGTVQRMSAGLPRDRKARRRLEKGLPDGRLRDLLPTRSRWSDVPYSGVRGYADRSFGSWRVTGAPDALLEALATRLDERGVDVRASHGVHSIEALATGAFRIAVEDGTVEDFAVVVIAADPVPLLAEHRGLRRISRAMSGDGLVATVTYFGLSVADPVPRRLVIHGDRRLEIDAGGSAPEGSSAWTVVSLGAEPDLLARLAAVGIRVDDAIVVRHGGKETIGRPWSGWSDVADRAAYAEPLPGLHVLPARLLPDASPSDAVWAAAGIAAAVGKA